jgi:hypothetical protein
MNTVIALLAVFGLQFLITQADGPFGVIAWMRNWLIRNKYFGVFFYQLLSCPLCSGWWAGLTIYFLSQESYKLNGAILWGLSGSATCLILGAILDRLQRQ